MKIIIKRSETKCSDRVGALTTKSPDVYYGWKSFTSSLKALAKARVILTTTNAIFFEIEDSIKENFMMGLAESTSIDFDYWVFKNAVSDQHILSKYQEKIVPEVTTKNWLEIWATLPIADDVKEIVAVSYTDGDLQFVHEIIESLLNNSYSVELDSLFAKLPQNQIKLG